MNGHEHHQAMDLLSEPTLVQFISRMFTSDFMPHGHCFFWRPEILWLHVASDFTIGLAYYLIPLALFQFVRKRQDLVFNWMFLLFAGFILACGTTHFMSIWTMWHGTYRLDGVIKLITAIISMVTAVLLYPLIPRALQLRSPRQLEAEVRRRTRELNMRKAQLEKTNEALQAATQNLTRINSQLEQFAYIASHDLQEPLRTVAAYSDLVSQTDPSKNPAEYREWLRFIHEAALRGQGLVSDLLEFSQASFQEKDFAQENFKEIAQTAVDNLQSQIQSEGGEVRIGALPVLPAIRAQILQLFQNLLSNALKYHGEKKPLIEIDAQEQGDHYLFSVKDNGLGISPEHHEKIFRLFQRLHSRSKYPGTGLGLSLCKKIIENHQGRIWVESREGAGSTFFFLLPKKINA